MLTWEGGSGGGLAWIPSSYHHGPLAKPLGSVEPGFPAYGVDTSLAHRVVECPGLLHGSWAQFCPSLSGSEQWLWTVYTSFERLTAVWLESSMYAVSFSGSQLSWLTDHIRFWGWEICVHRASLELGREVDCEAGRTPGWREGVVAQGRWLCQLCVPSECS